MPAGHVSAQEPQAPHALQGWAIWGHGALGQGEAGDPQPPTDATETEAAHGATTGAGTACCTGIPHAEHGA